MSATSAVRPLNVALVAALESDPRLLALLGGEARIWSLLAPPNTPLPYVIVGEATEGRWRVFAGGGTQNAETLHIWAKDKLQCADIVDALARILDGTKLAVAGFSTFPGQCSLIAIARDVDGKSVHGVVRYEAWCQPSAAGGAA